MPKPSDQEPLLTRASMKRNPWLWRQDPLSCYLILRSGTRAGVGGQHHPALVQGGGRRTPMDGQARALGRGRRCPSDTDKYAQGDSLAGRLMAKNYRSSGHVHRPAQTRLEAEVSVRDRGFCILGKRLLALVICP